MSICSFFSKLKYGSYKNSSRPAFYEEVADQFDVSPQHVYELQHGKTRRSWLDGVISDELRARASDKTKSWKLSNH